MSNARELLEELGERLRGVTQQLEREDFLEDVPAGAARVALESLLAHLRREVDEVADELGGAVDDAIVEMEVAADELARKANTLDFVAELVEDQDAGRAMSARDAYELRLALHDAGYFRVVVAS